MKLKEFARAPQEPVVKDAQIPGQLTVDECIAEAEKSQFEQATTPNKMEIYYSWSPRRYYKLLDCLLDAQWIEVPSVTTVLNVLDKSGALTYWGMKVGIAGCVALADKGVLTLEGPVENPRLEEQILEKLVENKLTVNHVKDQAADRGVNVHNALETWADSGAIPQWDDWPEVESGYVQGLAGLLGAIQGVTEGIQAEVMVGSLEHLYAGRYDLRLELKKPVEVVTKTYPKRADKVEEIPAGKYLLDLKTSKRVYDTHFLQLEAYEQASIECGYGETDRRGVVHVTADGKYELVLNKDWRFDDFQAVRHCYQVMHERKIVQALRDDFNAVNVT